MTRKGCTCSVWERKTGSSGAVVTGLQPPPSVGDKVCVRSGTLSAASSLKIALERHDHVQVA
jgi:hypothetical protein